MKENLPDHLPNGIQELLAYPSFWQEQGLWIFLGALVFLLGILLLYYIWRKQKRVQQSPKIVDPMNLLLNQLRDLVLPEPFEGRAIREYFFILSGTFRHLIELCTRVQATNLTNKELKQPLREKLPLRKDEIEELLRCLDRCELIQFAEAFVSRQEAEGLSLQVKEWAQLLVPHRLESESNE